MASTLALPSALARHTGGQNIFTTPESSLGKALSALSKQYSLGEVVLAEDGKLQPYIRVVINNRMLGKAQLENPDNVELSDDSVELKTAFAGG